MLSIKQLIAYLEAHDVEAWEGQNEETKGKIRVLECWQMKDERGIIFADSRVITLEPTLSTVRNFLGY